MQMSLVIAGGILCAVASVGLYVNHVGEEQAQTNQLRAEAELSEGLSLPRSPSGTLRSLHSLIGYAVTQKGAERACSLMTKPAQQAFATAYGQPDCPAAARMLGGEVTNRNRYPQYKFPDSAEIILGDTGSMDGCTITWQDVLDPADMPDAGPRLGMFTMSRVVGLGFKITGFEPCPAGHIPSTTSGSPHTSASSAVSTPTSTATPNTSPATGLLPSYAPAVPGVLAARIAHGGTGACDLFSDGGRAEFARGQRAADCPAAVAGMRAKVTDSNVYADPHGATAVPGAAGRVVVDGCHLTWYSWSGANLPGPPVGYLELERPAGQAGYVITGYRPC